MRKKEEGWSTKRRPLSFHGNKFRSPFVKSFFSRRETYVAFIMIKRIYIPAPLELFECLPIRVYVLVQLTSVRPLLLTIDQNFVSICMCVKDVKFFFE